MDEEAGKAEEGRTLKDFLGRATAVLAVSGVVLYGGMSFAMAWVYEPAGVSLRDLGMTSGALLGQAAAGLVGFLLLLGIVVIAMMIGAVILGTVKSAEYKNPGGLVEQASSGTQPQINPFEAAWLQLQMLAGAVGMALVLGCVLAVIAAIGAFAFVASDSRDSIAAGKQPGFLLGLPLPWNAQITEVHALPGSARDLDRLPSCALYLGQADGTVLLRDGLNRQTLRVPASSVRLDLVDRHECEPAGQPTGR